MARAKRASDDVYNARRRIRRAADRAERSGRPAEAARLRRIANETYIGRDPANAERASQAALAGLRLSVAPRDRAHTRIQMSSLVSTLRKIAHGLTSIGASAQRIKDAIIARKNANFERQINLASMDAPSALDRHNLSGKAQARIFWMSTRRFWLGESPDRRYEAIMSALGTNSIEEAWNRVLDLNASAIASAINVESAIRNTLTDMIDESGDEPQSIGSPDKYMYFVRDAYNLINLMS